MSWTAPRTWVAGELVTAALLNVHLRDNLKAIGLWAPGDLKASWSTHANATSTTLTEAQTGWYICNGATFVQANHPALYAALGNTTTLPDLRGRGLWFPGTQDGHAFSRNDNGGEYDHVISVAEMPTHSHSGTLSGNTGAGSSHNHGIGGSTGTEAAHTHSGSGLSAAAQSAGTPSGSVGITDPGHVHDVYTDRGSGATPAAGSGVTYLGPEGTGAAASHTTGITASFTGSALGTHSHTISGNTGAGSSHSHTLPSSTGSESTHTHPLSGSFSTVNQGSGSTVAWMPPFVVGGMMLIKNDN